MAMWQRLWKWKVGAEPAHLTTGRWGEREAEAFMRGQGMKILGRRVRVKPRGEIDLVAREGDTLVFIEVKTRASERMGRPFAAVNPRKRAQLGRAAMGYMRSLPSYPRFFRFDVVEVIGVPAGDPAQVRHIRNAFTLPRSLRIPPV